MKEVKIGRVYRHFKGNYYFVENVAYDSESKERMLYINLYIIEKMVAPFGLDLRKCF